MTLAVDIKSKGYWQTVIRPSRHVENRISDLASVPVVLGGLSINRRGWDFPHIDRPESTQIGNDWVGQDTVWEEFHELWRVTQSGQFLHLGGIRYDWGAGFVSPAQQRADGVQLMGIGDSLHRLSEILEFAQRWGNSVATSEKLSLAIEIGGLLNRQLIIDDPWRSTTSMPYVSRAGEPFKWSGDIEPGTSLDELWSTAREVASRLFARFGFQANAQVLEDWQTKIGK